MVGWVQGQRAHLDARRSISWMELLYRRVTCDFDAIPSGEKTKEAEAGLGIDESTYFYVECPHPQFGDSVIAFVDTARELAAVSPFDTGGLWFGHVPLNQELDNAAKQVLVARWSIECPDYQLPFAEWVGRSIGSLQDYRTGVRPDAVVVEEIDLSTASSQSWTWEARLRKNVGAGASVAPDRVYLMEGRRAAYLSWLRDQRWFSGEERSFHLRWVSEHVSETANPVDDMIEYLARS